MPPLSVTGSSGSTSFMVRSLREASGDYTERRMSGHGRTTAARRALSSIGERMTKLLPAMLFAMSAVPAIAADSARDYPNRPVRVINPFPPGGSSDPSCRLLADALTRALGQQFVVDNRGGGNGNIGTAIAAKATPDGYVLVFASGTTFTINPHVYSSLGFDPKKDFTPVIRFGSVPNVLVVHPSLPPRTLAEFTQYVKSRGGDLNYASAGNGSSMHLAGEMYQKMTGTKMQH